MKYSKINIKNPKILRYYKNGRNHEAVCEALGNYIDETGSWGLHFLYRSPSMWNDTNQNVVTIAVPKGCPDVERIKEEILAIVPHLFKTKDGYVRLFILHNSQNVDGTYTIVHWPKDGRWGIQKTTMGEKYYVLCRRLAKKSRLTNEESDVTCGHCLKMLSNMKQG